MVVVRTNHQSRYIPETVRRGTLAVSPREALTHAMIDWVQWRNNVSRWGLLRSGYMRIMVWLKRWFTLCRVHVREQHPVARPHNQMPGIAVRQASLSELLRAARDPALDLHPVAVAAALRRGDICVGAFDQESNPERLVGYTWRSFTTAPHADGLWVVIERPNRYGYKAFTHPDFRGRHLQDFVAYHTDALCLERGFRYALSIIETHNFPSIASDMRRGNRVVGWAGYIKLFGRVFPFRSRGARRHTFRFVKPRSP